VDPEHLRDKEWREIMEGLIFWSNVLFGCVDKVHLINVWGLSFHTAFTTIGAFLHGRFPASISVVGLTATLEPGSSTISVCKSLGFFKGNFKFIRRSNERPNTQFTIQFITRGLNGEKFASIPSCWKESNRGWLEDPLIRTSKGEPKGDSSMVDGDS